jgi:hypothetical protein
MVISCMKELVDGRLDEKAKWWVSKKFGGLDRALMSSWEGARGSAVKRQEEEEEEIKEIDEDAIE